MVDQFNLKDQMQGKQPQENKLVERLDERKNTEKQAITDEPSAPVPYPQRLNKNKPNKQFTKFMECLRNCISTFCLQMHCNRCSIMSNL